MLLKDRVDSTEHRWVTQQTVRCSTSVVWGASRLFCPVVPLRTPMGGGSLLFTTVVSPYRYIFVTSSSKLFHLKLWKPVPQNWDIWRWLLRAPEYELVLSDFVLLLFVFCWGLSGNRRQLLTMVFRGSYCSWREDSARLMVLTWALVARAARHHMDVGATTFELFSDKDKKEWCVLLGHLRKIVLCHIVLACLNEPKETACRPECTL